MSDNQKEPREYDAVLGGQNSIPVNAAVLGGISGVKMRLASPAVEVRIAALSEALKYGEAGLDLIIGVLHDESMQVKLAAYSLLKDRDDLKIKPQFQDYLPTFEFDVITVDSYGRENSRTKSFARFFPEDLGNSIVLEMVYIPGGTFMMGSPDSESDRRDRESPQHRVPFTVGQPDTYLPYVHDTEIPQHRVTVPTFYAGKYPITQAQWEAVMRNNPSTFKGEKLPVGKVSWNQAIEFCNKLSQTTGKTYRLLSESEWEYACRADTTTPFHFGESITPELVNYNGNFTYANAPKGLYREQQTDVGTFPPNAFGLYDMHGNVYEWCSDEWHSNYDGAPTDGSSWKTERNNNNYYRVARGGQWYSCPEYCRSAVRNISDVFNDHGDYSFRVACVAAWTS